MKTRIIAVIVVLCTLCSGCSSAKTDAQSTAVASSAGPASEMNSASPVPEIVTMYGEFVYDTKNKYEAVGIHDYVFTGTVTGIRDPEYPFEQSYLNNEGEETVISGPMFTNLSISVTEVIKGDLAAGKQLDVYKSGGYDAADKVYYLYDNDVYPEIGREYLFLASIDSDGVLWMSAPETVIPLEPYGTMISTYSESDQTPERQSIIDAYTEAYQNEIPYIEETCEDSAFPDATVIVE